MTNPIDGIPTVTYDPKNPFMFKGTEQKLNYYLIAQTGPIILGVRILAHQISDTEAHVGFRIRCQTMPGHQGHVDPAAYTSTWPQIEWSKADGIRASKVMLQTVQMEPGQWDQLDKVVKKARLIGKLMALLGAAVPIQDLAYEQEDLEEVLMGEITKQMGIQELSGNTGKEGEATANKSDPLVDGNEAVTQAALAEKLKQHDPSLTDEQAKADAAELIEKAKTVMPSATSEIQKEVEGLFGELAESMGTSKEDLSKAFGASTDAAEAGSPLATFLLDDDDDDDSGMLPN